MPVTVNVKPRTPLPINFEILEVNPVSDAVFDDTLVGFVGNSKIGPEFEVTESYDEKLGNITEYKTNLRKNEKFKAKD